MHSLFLQASSLTEEVIAAVVRVQKHFGIGALESIYVRCLERDSSWPDTGRAARKA